jgi:hypothetical protein
LEKSKCGLVAATVKAMASRRALLGTTDFASIAGSEILLIELAEELAKADFECDLVAFSIGQPAEALAKKAKINVRRKPAEVRPLTYDLVWLQTQIGPALDFSPGPNERENTLFLFAHLDLKWNLAGPGLVMEELIADRFMFCSPEARDHFGSQGLNGERALVFHNAAPAEFSRVAGSKRETLQRLLIVSNHAPAEVVEAVAILRRGGLHVECWGRGGDVAGRRLSALDVQSTDAIVTIGKTVQYALRARVPVYVYDHLGGPGWLTSENFDRCAHFNFSGRCTLVKKDAAQIASEVHAGFSQATAYAATCDIETMPQYHLERLVQDLVDEIPRSCPLQDRRRLLLENAVALGREKKLATAIGHYFAAWKRGVVRIAKLENGSVQRTGQRDAVPPEPPS